jgi:hypothetical protein
VVQLEPSRTRQAQGSAFARLMSDGAGVALGATAAAAPFVPGAAVLSAAVSSVAAVSATARSTSAVAAAVPAGGPVATTPAGGAPEAIGRLEQLTEASQELNLQYLMLQQQMQDENRRYSVISNVLKTKHDTAKNSIGNVR